MQKYPPIYRGLYILALKNRGYIVFAPNRKKSNEEPKNKERIFIALWLFHSDFPNTFTYYLKLVWK